MRTTTLILCLGATAAVLLAQTTNTPPASTVEPDPAPYIVRVTALDETAATSLRQALADLPGVDAVETIPGDQPAAHVRTRPGHYVSRTQVEAIVRRQGLALDDFEIPQWARFRAYVVEASGGA